MSIVFPSTLTEEELNLKKRYEWLRKIRKVIKEQEANKQQQQNAGRIDAEKRKKTVKSVEEQANAMEEAKRLIKSGQVTIKNDKNSKIFKRKKIKDGDTTTAKFTPYSPAMLGDYASTLQDSNDVPFPSGSGGGGPSGKSPRKPNSSNLYSNFISSSQQQRGDRNSESGEGWGGRSNDVAGRVIYIRGFDLMDDPLRKAFADFGKVISLNIDDRRRGANMEFEAPAQAKNAIKEMNGNMVNGVTIRVSMARKQGWNAGGHHYNNNHHQSHPPPHPTPQQQPPSISATPSTADSSPLNIWSKPPPPKMQKTQETRNLVAYEDDTF